MKISDKLEIADEMLEAAVIEYLDNHRYFVALNLACVAEELYGKYANITTGSNAMQVNIRAANEFAALDGVTDISIKEWKKIAGQSKNSIKHFDTESDRYIEIDAEDESRLAIADALSNHSILNRAVTHTLQRLYDFGRELALKNAHIQQATNG